MKRSFARWRANPLAQGATLAAVVGMALVTLLVVVGGNGEDASEPLEVPQTRPEASDDANGSGIGRASGSRDRGAKGSSGGRDRQADAGDRAKAKGKDEARRSPASGSPSDAGPESGRSSDRGESLTIFGGKVERTPSDKGGCRLTLPSGETRTIDDCELPGR